MKKIYKKPSLVVENFVTEEVMGQDNLLSEVKSDIYGQGYFGTGNYVSFENGESSVLTGINYQEFAN